MEKQWIWANSNGGMSAAIADFDDEIIQWLDEPGCACSSHTNMQKFDEFLANGPRYLFPPDDVLEEMRTALEQVLST